MKAERFSVARESFGASSTWMATGIFFPCAAPPHRRYDPHVLGEKDCFEDNLLFPKARHQLRNIAAGIDENSPPLLGPHQISVRHNAPGRKRRISMVLEHSFAGR
jgi:hypothetical protein